MFVTRSCSANDSCMGGPWRCSLCFDIPFGGIDHTFFVNSFVFHYNIGVVMKDNECNKLVRFT